MPHDRRVVPFRAVHYGWLVSRPGFGALDFEVNDDILAYLEKSGKWFTGVVDGDPIAIAGVLTQWKGRHVTHAILGVDTGPHMLWITRATLKVLGGLEGRIEMTVRQDFKMGHRWAAMLGFEREALMKRYGPEREDHMLYVRFN